MNTLDGRKKFTVTLLTFLMILLNTYLGKDLNIDVVELVNVLFAAGSAVYVVVQTVHDAFKEKRKWENGEM